MFLKNINDISIKDGKWVVERSDLLNLTDIEKQISELKYSGIGLTKDELIEQTKFPPFMQVFYYLVYQLRSIPDEQRFFSEYIKWIDADIQNEEIFKFKGQEFNLSGLKARLLRTYPSLIRDIHFYYFLLEKSNFEKITYSLKNDYWYGIDIRVTRDDLDFCISLLIDTPRSRFFKEKKEKRHDYTKIKEIILDVNFYELNKIGDFYLLGRKQLEDLNQKIDGLMKSE